MQYNLLYTYKIKNFRSVIFVKRLSSCNNDTHNIILTDFSLYFTIIFLLIHLKIILNCLFTKIVPSDINNMEINLYPLKLYFLVQIKNIYCRVLFSSPLLCVQYLFFYFFCFLLNVFNRYKIFYNIYRCLFNLLLFTYELRFML